MYIIYHVFTQYEPSSPTQTAIITEINRHGRHPCHLQIAADARQRLHQRPIPESERSWFLYGRKAREEGLAVVQRHTLQANLDSIPQAPSTAY
jgi:hypothetical protein